MALVLLVHVFRWNGMQTHPKISLIEHFKDFTDPRVERTRDHDLIDEVPCTDSDAQIDDSIIDYEEFPYWCDTTQNQGGAP